MSTEPLRIIDQYFQQDPIPYLYILKMCKAYNMENLGWLIGKIWLNSQDSIENIQSLDSLIQKMETNTLTISNNNVRRVKMLCNWCDSKTLCMDWKKLMNPNSHIELTSEDTNIDYWVIINKPPNDAYYIPEKTIVFHMEPNMPMQEHWGEFSNPSPSKYLKVCTHESEYNNMIWEISSSYYELYTKRIQKDEDKSTKLSTILSSKYFDPGHKLRIDFIKHIENDVEVDVYGSNHFNYKNYKGSLPRYKKDDGIFPYKYTFNVENNFIPNYCTEKLIDAILSECLCFYRGPPNIKEILDENAYILLDLEDFEKDKEIIKKAISEDLWSKKISYILREKQRILNTLQFCPRLEKIIKEHEEKENEKF